MNKFVKMAILGVGVCLAGTASAGYKVYRNVTIVKNADGSGYFNGGLGTAHNNNIDPAQDIGCRVSVDSTNTYLVYCSAQKAGGVQAYCNSSSPEFARLALSIVSDTDIQVNFDGNGLCTKITTWRYSHSEPKQKL